MGAWTTQPTMHWTNIYVENTGTLHRLEDGIVYDHVKEHETRHCIRFDTGEAVDKNFDRLQQQGVPAMVQDQGRYVEAKVRPSVRDNREQPTTLETFKDHVATLPPHLQRILRNLQETPGATRVLKRALQRKSKIQIASDGSLEHRRGSFGWVMVVNGQRIWRGSGPADGNPQQMSST